MRRAAANTPRLVTAKVTSARGVYAAALIAQGWQIADGGAMIGITPWVNLRTANGAHAGAMPPPTAVAK